VALNNLENGFPPSFLLLSFFSLLTISSLITCACCKLDTFNLSGGSIVVAAYILSFPFLSLFPQHQHDLLVVLFCCTHFNPTNALPLVIPLPPRLSHSRIHVQLMLSCFYTPTIEDSSFSTLLCYCTTRKSLPHRLPISSFCTSTYRTYVLF